MLPISRKSCYLQGNEKEVYRKRKIEGNSPMFLGTSFKELLLALQVKLSFNVKTRLSFWWLVFQK